VTLKSNHHQFFKKQARHRAYSMRLLAAFGLQAAPVLRRGGMLF
jgi:hypothetical protein